MKARNVFERAMLLYGVTDYRGGVDQTRAEPYAQRALAAISAIQDEIYMIEHSDGTYTIPDPITDLDDELAISDESAMVVMVYGLIMYFAEWDRDSFAYNTYNVEYTNRMQAINRPRQKIQNVRQGARA